MRQIFTAIGEDRIHSMKLAMEKLFSDGMDEKFKSAIQRVTVGKDGCSVLDLHWVPDSLKSIGQGPENLMGFGAPHFHMFITGTRKVGPEDIPFWGPGGSASSSWASLGLAGWSRGRPASPRTCP